MIRNTILEQQEAERHRKLEEGNQNSPNQDEYSSITTNHLFAEYITEGPLEDEDLSEINQNTQN